MSAADNLHLVTIDQLSDERREVVHELVKAKTETWWHNMPNVWIVGGQGPEYWRDELSPVIKGTGATLLVMSLPASARAWSVTGPDAKAKFKWFHEFYTP